MLWVLFAHYIGDIALQSSWQADNKGKLWYVMLSHCMIWTACICVALQYLGLLEYWKVPVLFVGHFLMDEWKAHRPHDATHWWMIYPDQLWHLAQCVVVVFL